MAPGQTKESFMKGLIKGGVGKVKKNQQGMVKYLGASNRGANIWSGEGREWFPGPGE